MVRRACWDSQTDEQTARVTDKQNSRQNGRPVRQNGTQANRADRQTNTVAGGLTADTETDRWSYTVTQTDAQTNRHRRWADGTDHRHTKAERHRNRGGCIDD